MSAANGLTVFLPKRLKATGGTSTFARNFKRGMEQRGHRVVLTWQPDYDVLLVSPTAPLRYLVHAKLWRRSIVHRLDGVYYPGSSAGWLWRVLNLQLSLIRTVFADTVVYQSRYSQWACTKFLLPAVPAQRASSIYNGVDTNHFTPQGVVASLRDNPTQHLFITASRFRTTDQIIPLLNTFTRYRQYHQPNAKLVVVGPFEEKVVHVPKQFGDTAGVTFHGTVTHAELPAYLRAADVFVMTHKTPPCPNNVLEALACGLPVCGVADGAMPELITSGVEGELVPEPRQYAPFPTESLAERLTCIMRNRTVYAESARTRALREFTLARSLQEYDLLLRNTAQPQSAKQ